MKKIVYFFTVLFSQQIIAQVPEDALRMSWNIPSGTARNQAIGGAMGSLGGDITSVFVNPAGLGLYKTGEVVISPAFSFFKDKTNYLGTPSKTGFPGKFNFGASGIVFGHTNPNSRWSNKTISFAVNRTANFNGRTFYKGENNYSSFTESFAEELSQSGVPIDAILYTAPLTMGTKLATYTYLIDTLTVNGQTEVVGLPLRDAIINGTALNLYQEKDIKTKGGITEIAIGYASNMDDKIYIGVSLGFPIVNFERSSTITEKDLTGNTDNNFNYAVYQQDYKTQGVGVKARLGIIVKPADGFRAGLTINTPTFYGLKDTETGRIEADLENYVKGLSVANADSIYTQFDAAIPEYRYDLISPFKLLLSGSYVFNEMEDISKQKGFITADVEYIPQRASRYSISSPENGDYYKGVNEAIRNSYKGTFNFRAGGELKFNTFMTRLGFAYYGNPYKTSALQAHKMNLSGGIGYRDKGIFLDLTYVHSLIRDSDVPYRLSDKDNTFAVVKNRMGTVLVTAGFKF